MAEKLNIVGPCAGESLEQMSAVVNWVDKQQKHRSVHGFRGNLFKPRTYPGFEGKGIVVMDWIFDALRNLDHQADFVFATEVLIPEHVTAIATKIAEATDITLNMILWLGSRNQNHIIQREIAKRIKEEMPQSTHLMIKNPPWPDKKHWLGVLDHVSPYVPTERLLTCNRGFHPWPSLPNPQKLRNIPIWEFAMEVKEESGIPMLNDPSHEGGSVENVLAMFALSRQFAFDGDLIEAHPQPSSALTDKNQQLSLEQAEEMLEEERL